MFGFTTTRRHEREINALKGRLAQAIEQRDNARSERQAFRSAAETAGRQFAEADAANRRLDGRNLRLGERLAALAESDPEYATALEHRLNRALTAAARYLDAYWTQREQTLTAAKQRNETAALLKGVNERLATSELRSSKAEAELRAFAMYRGERLLEGGTPRRLTPSDELQRARAHNRALEARLQEMTVANQRCTCQRQGVTS